MDLDPRTTALVMIDLQTGVLGPHAATAVLESAASSASAELHEFALRHILPRIAVIASSSSLAFQEG